MFADNYYLHMLWVFMLGVGMTTVTVFLLAVMVVLLSETYDEVRRRYTAYQWSRRRKRRQARTALIDQKGDYDWQRIATSIHNSLLNAEKNMREKNRAVNQDR